MRAPLDVVVGRQFNKRIVILYAVLGPVALLCVLNAVNAARSKYGSLAMAAIWLAMGAMMLAIPMALVLARRRYVARFDERGVTLRNGRTFAWADFQRVEPRFLYRRGATTLNHHELVFTTGRAGVFHQVAENRLEVEEVIQSITSGKNAFVA